jgi:hypothetical protein
MEDQKLRTFLAIMVGFQKATDEDCFMLSSEIAF